MYTASVTVNLSNKIVSSPKTEIYFYGSATSTNISSSTGTISVALPTTMHSGSSAKTFMTISQLDTSTSTRAKLSFSYSIPANCQTATIYFRDLTGTIANGTSISVSFIVVQDQT